MTEKHSILCIIPARGGSTGVPGKNIKLFCGKPLISYTIEAALKSSLFDKVVVSTDSQEIADISRECGADVPYLRPTELATSESNVVDAVIHMLDLLHQKEAYEPDILFLLQPTSPLREAGDIRAAYKQFLDDAAPALVSVCRTHYEVLHIEEGRIRVINPGEAPLINRQEHAPAYKQDGSMIYIIKVPYLREHRTFTPVGETSAYINPKWKAVDIDDPEDFELAEVLYQNRDAFKNI